jgi:hypothetical protein
MPGPLRTKEIAVGRSKMRVRTALAVHDADRLAVNGLHLRIDARARPIAEAVAHHLREMAHNRGVLTMQDPDHISITPLRRLAWNKGKLIGAKPPLRPKHVWAIRTKLQVEGRTRELAMFNLVA